MIKAGDTFETPGFAHLEVHKFGNEGAEVQLEIAPRWFSGGDIKALRKFLKKLQRQMEQAALESLD